MRVLYCNKYNYPFSGTEVYLFELMEMMRSWGHDVALFSMADPRGKATPYDRHFVTHIDFKGQNKLWGKVRLAAHALYSRNARQRIRAMIQEFHPDVAHVRNIYHHLSPSILWELKAQNVPVVYHINDFKLLCPTYNLLSRGKVCEDCKGGRFWHALKSHCYPGLGARATLAAEAYLHKWLGTYRQCVDLFLAPSQFVRDKFVEHGWDARKFSVLPHSQNLRSPTEPNSPTGNSILYFGRLSPEKGLADLIRAMTRVPHLHLIVAGDGPQRKQLEELVATLEVRNVEFIGHVSGDKLGTLIAQSRFTVLPSHAYETLGKTILESYAEGRPVVASDMGSRRELIRDRKTGLLYPAGDVNRLAEVIESLTSKPELIREMGLAGWRLVRERYTPEAHYLKLMALYEKAIATKKRAGAKTVLVSRKQNPPWSRVSSREIQTQSPSTSPRTSRPPKIRVAFIGGRGVISKYSGIETYYEEVGKQLAQRGHEITAYCRNYFTPALSEHNGMRLVRLPTIRSKHLETLIHTVLSTAHVLTQPCEIVHYHALGPALFSFLPRLFGKKTVVTVQGLDWQRGKWGRFASVVLRLGEWAAVKLPNGTMVVSQTLQQHYRDAYGVETSYVPNGGMLRERRTPSKILDWGLEPGKYILFLGRFSPEKGCHLLVEAYEKLNTEVKLVMAGAPSYCDDYVRQLRAHESDRVKMLDWVSGETLDELLTNAMLFVLPSDLEGLSLALLDAMGAGVCVVTSGVPENREVVQDAGFTFERGNAADLAERLRFLIANPALRESAARAGRARIQERYLWPNIALEIEKTYFQVMGLEHLNTSGKKPSTSVVETAVESSATTERRAV
jgi:glycosyltransferase involved in cell wall biosynthesis